MDKLHRLAYALGITVLLTGPVVGADPSVPAAQPAPPAADPSAASVYVRSLNLVGPEYKTGKDVLRPVNWTSGTAVVLLVSRPAGGLILLDDQATQLAKFTDDKGTDLLKAPQPPPAYPARPVFGYVPPDGLTATVTIHVPVLPAKGAKEIALRGVLVFRTATRQATAEQSDVPLTEGSQISTGPYDLEITKVGKQDARPGAGGLTITLQANQDLSDIVAIKFFDEAGKEIQAFKRGWGSSGPGNDMTAYQTYDLARKADAVTVKITYWTDPRDIEVPLDVKLGLGL
jgi:hypothetical protein